MLGIFRSECLKMRHTFSLKLIVLAPLTTLFLGYLLSGNFVQFTVYNWWYTVILPVTVSIWCANMISHEKGSRYQNISCLPVDLKVIWSGKVLTVIMLLFVSSLFIWSGCTTFGIFTLMNISPFNGLIGSMLLFFTYLWQIPLIMLTAVYAGYLPAILISCSCNMILPMLGVKHNWFICNPFSIPARIVCPFFGMQPNGIPLESGSALFETDMILPAVSVSLLLFAAMFLFTAKLFAQEGSYHD